MLTHFPAALPDELLYSRLARYHLHSGSTSAKRTLDDLFGDRSVRAAIDLQCHLRGLSARISELTPCSSADLLRGTSWGYYASYQPASVGQAAQKAMLDGPAEGLHARLGIAAGMRLPPFPLRWCQRCYAEAMKLHGEAYWRRANQLPGVLVCPSHGLPLRNAHLPDRVGQHDFVAATFRTCPAEPPHMPGWAGNPSLMQMLWRIACQSGRLLDHPAIFFDLAALTDHCSRRLIAADLALPSGRLRLKHLSDAARTGLAPLKGLFPETDSTDWLVAMGRKHRQTFSPLQHLLFDHVISDTAQQIGPERNREPEPRRFLANDPGFETQLRRAAIEANSLRGAARMVGVDPKTIQHHAARLQLAGPWVLRAPSPKATAPDPAFAIKRRWRAALATGGNRTELRRKLPAEWVWLKRHDPHWLEANSPAPQQRSGTTGPRIDWTTLDVELATAIFEAAVSIRQEAPPRRVTQSEIERRLGRLGWFGPRLTKLLECRAVFATVVESLDRFRIRRIRWARGELIAQCIGPAPWRVSKLAGLSKHISKQVFKELRSFPCQREIPFE